MEQGGTHREDQGRLMDYDTSRTTYDVVVVGAGNAAFCAALAAAEAGKKVLVLERAPENESGGNSRFTEDQKHGAYDRIKLSALPPLK